MSQRRDHSAKDKEAKASTASRRFGQLVQNKLAQVDRSYFGSIVSSRRWRSWLFVDSSTGSELLTPSQAHFGADARQMPRDDGLRMGLRVLDSSRRKLGLSRMASVLLLLLAILGLGEAWSHHVSKGQHPEADRLHPWAAATRHKFLQTFHLQDEDRLPRTLQPVEPDVSAILLNWKRLENLEILVKHTCSLPFVQTVLVWNVRILLISTSIGVRRSIDHQNNPDMFLTRAHLANAACPPNRLRIVNSPSNQLFVARHTACASMSRTP